MVRQVVDTSACNQCHDPLALHGGQRVDTRFCALCHTPQNIDPESGNSLDFKVFIHKLHRGDRLPTVQAGQDYIIVGFNQTPFDPSEIGFPQDIRNCTTCHKNAPQADNWKNAPNAAACTSCHDNVNPLTGQGHAGGAQTDATCKNCHTNTQNTEFDFSVPGAHLLPTRSTQLRGVEFSLVRATNVRSGQSPTVVFGIKDRAGDVIAPSEMTSFRLMIAGPTSDYQSTLQEVATGATAVGDGTFSYTFTGKLPDSAAGTFAVGIEGYIQTTIQGQTATVRDAGFNQIMYVTVTDAVPLPRKTIVSRDNCNQCHLDLGNPAGLSIHGGSRRNTQYCIFCHNANGTDAALRPADRMPPVTINFKQLIHRIHKGEEGTEPIIVFGNQSSLHDFSEVLFPGDLRNCVKCHIPNAQLVDFVHEGVQPTIVRQGNTVVNITQPITAACTSCHDSSQAKAHAVLQTTADGTETCIVCHGEGADFAVSRVHAR